MSKRVIALIVMCAMLAVADGTLAETSYTVFGKPERVTIRGYDGDAMEPFITRDDQYLLFNNRNDPTVNTNLHYARRIDGTTFEYMGEIGGVNTTALEGVPTMDTAGNFYFVSTQRYADTFSTLYRGRFADGQVSDVKLVEGVSRKQAGLVNFDVEVSPDGNTLYFVDAQFNTSGMPLSADLVMAVRRGDRFERVKNSVAMLAKVNTDVLEYAAAISADGLELFFTRADLAHPAVGAPRIYRTVRDRINTPFEQPELVSTIEGFVEAPTISMDGRSLYYHKLEQGKYVIYRATR